MSSSSTYSPQTQARSTWEIFPDSGSEPTSTLDECITLSGYDGPVNETFNLGAATILTKTLPKIIALRIVSRNGEPFKFRYRATETQLSNCRRIESVGDDENDTLLAAGDIEFEGNGTNQAIIELFYIPEPA